MISLKRSQLTTTILPNFSYFIMVMKMWINVDTISLRVSSTKKETHTEKDTHRERHTERYTERETDTLRKRHRERQRHKERDRNTQKDRDTCTYTERDRDTHREIEIVREREKERESEIFAVNFRAPLGVKARFGAICRSRGSQTKTSHL